MTQRNREFLWSTGLCLMMTVVIAALFSAESAWVWYHIDEPIAPGPLSDFLAMRQGVLTVLDLEQLRGLVTFPSFHTSAAVLLAVAVLAIRLSRAVSEFRLEAFQGGFAPLDPPPKA